jgi:hypothetical protein
VENQKDGDRAEVFSRRIKAGKRTYFFDVKPTRGEDYYITITESKKRQTDDGFVFEKHKVFLYKEDFAKFVGALEETIGHIKELMPGYDFNSTHREESEAGHADGYDGNTRW